MDSDENTPRNIFNHYSTVNSTGIGACGEESPGLLPEWALSETDQYDVGIKPCTDLYTF